MGMVFDDNFGIFFNFLHKILDIALRIAVP